MTTEHNCLESDWDIVECDKCDECEIRICVDCGKDVDA